MAWIDELDLRRVVASTLGLRDVGSLPDHWTPLCVDAVEEAYHFIRAALAARNFSPAQMDAWDSRRVYNRRVALCIVYTDRDLPEGQASFNAVDRACKAKEELATLTLTVNGVQIDPEGAGATIGFGRFVDDPAAFPNSIEMDTRL